MFGNFPFGFPYFGQPTAPTSTTGTGSLVQSAQTMAGIGRVPIAAGERSTGGGPIQLAWWRKKLLKQSRGIIDITAVGRLVQSPQYTAGRGTISYASRGQMAQGSQSVSACGKIRFDGRGKLRLQKGRVIGRAGMIFQGTGKITIQRDLILTEEDMAQIVLILAEY